MTTSVAEPAPPMVARRELGVAMTVVAVIAMLAACLGIGVRSIHVADVAVDEVQYALSALSLAEDGDLDISDELLDERWRDFADKKPPLQTEVRIDGTQISPHDPLLPVLLAVPMGLGGWEAAKATLAGFAAILAALTLWVAVRRFAIPLRPATIGVGLASASAPFAVYGQQLYPELPAALASVVAVAALTGSVRRRELALLVLAIVALPWLSVKYVPVAAAFAVLGAWRWWRAGERRELLLGSGALLAAAAVYLWLHQEIWGGWTVYASGDHFSESGEFSVVGTDPNYPGRAMRVVGLLSDREFGLIAWQPAAVLLPVALGSLARRRDPDSLALAVPLLAGWGVATFVALTMHGFWWPGRQLVIVLPLALLVVLRWLTQQDRPLRILALALGLLGVVSYGWLLVRGWSDDITWVVDFWDVGAPTYDVLRPLLPDYRDDHTVGHCLWTAAVATLVAAGWWSARSGPELPTLRGRRIGRGLVALGILATVAVAVAGWADDDGSTVRDSSSASRPSST